MGVSLLPRLRLKRQRNLRRGLLPASASAKKITQPSSATDQKGFVSYKVRSGDSLYSISKKYPGVSTAALQKANGLSSPDIRPGQVLKIPVG